MSECGSVCVCNMQKRKHFCTRKFFANWRSFYAIWRKTNLIFSIYILSLIVSFFSSFVFIFFLLLSTLFLLFFVFCFPFWQHVLYFLLFSILHSLNRKENQIVCLNEERMLTICQKDTRRKKWQWKVIAIQLSLFLLKNNFLKGIFSH